MARAAKRKIVPSPGERRGPRLALGFVLLAVLLTIDDRHVGSVADERQMIWTAVAIAETGELGQARGRDFTLARDEVGDAVSRYGMGMSIAQLPAAIVAPVIEERRGAGSSQPLFLVAPLLFVIAGAALAGRLVRRLGGGPRAEIYAILLASIASPLGSYAAMGFTEPLQGALLAATLYFALGPSPAASGLAAGLAVLTKSANLAVAPFLLLPLLASPKSRTKNVIASAAAFFSVLMIWLGFEIVRFRVPLSSYPGEGFTHPLLDGLWRLLISPTEGLIVFFPPAVVAVWIAVRMLRGDEWPRRLAAAGSLAATAVVLVLAAAYWGWHGNEGWGPRLILPAIPLLAPFAAAGLERWRASPAIALIAATFLLNLPPLVQHPTPIATYVTNLEWPAVSPSRAARVPGYARIEEPPGTFRISPDNVLATIPRATGFLVHPWFWRVTRAGDVAAARMLESPPWVSVRPDLVPRQFPMPAVLARYILRYPRWSFWGRGFRPEPDDVAYRAVYLEGLTDQVIRAQQLGRAGQSLDLATKLFRLAPSGESIALRLESLRLLGRVVEAKTFLGSQPASRRLDPRINVVLALFERDAGNEQAARVMLQNAAERMSAPAMQRALVAPIGEWPGDLHSMTAAPVMQVGSRVEP
ncbi:MAG TPA: hypothetical protein VMS98_03225 [Thermoanaerobaculia bacterium]|nr:hypothetical protein [Thermoanaerobaculia bacterium]